MKNPNIWTQPINFQSVLKKAYAPNGIGAVCVLIFFHLVKVTVWFRGIDFSSPWPVVNIDYVEYYARALRAHEFFTRSGRFWGYDPFEMAGYVSGPIHEVGSLLMSLVAHGVSNFVPIWSTILALEMLGFFVAPFSVVFFVRWIGGSWRQAWIGFGWTILMFGGYEFLSSGHRVVGLFSFFMACFLSLPAMASFYQWLKFGQIYQGGIFLILYIFLPMLHPVSVFILVVPTGLMFLLFLKNLNLNKTIFLSLSALIVLGVNYFWIEPYLTFLNWRVSVPYLSSLGISPFLQQISLFQPTVFLFIGSLIHLLIVGCALYALAHYFKSDLKLFAILSSWIVAIFLVVAWGSSWPEIRSIQPLRFIVLFWIILSAVGGIGADLLTQKYNVGVYRRIYEIFIMGFVMLAFGWVGLFSIPPASLVNALPEGQQKMMDYLRSNPSGSGRFLLECGDWPWPHFADILPFFTNQILLGGPGAGVFLASRSTLFIGRTVFIKKTVDGVTNIQNDNPTIFNKPFKSFDEKTFQSYLNLYNIHQIGAWSNLSVTYLQQFNQTLQNEGLYGDFTVFRVRNPKGWFFEGTGKLRMDYDELVLTDVSPGFLIIKCHWMKGLRTSPALPISPIYLLDDPVPFIQIDNTIGAKEVIIKNAGL